MNKGIWLLVLMIFLGSSCAGVGRSVEEPTPTASSVRNPQSLDDAWYWIEAGEHGWTFEPCGIGELTTPFATWGMALEAVEALTPDRVHPYLSIYGADISRIMTQGEGFFSKADLVRVTESSVFVFLSSEYFEGNIAVCGDQDRKPILHGVGVQNFLDWLAVQPLAPMP